MIKNIIFDFGDVFLNLDKEAPFRAFQTFGLMEWHADIQAINEQFEVGAIDEEQFIVKKDNTLINVINKFINSKYNRNVFYDVNHREYSDHIPNNVYCNIEDCECNKSTIIEGQKMYYCYDCYKSEYIRDNKYNYDVDSDPCYNLCPTHFTKENICNHKDGNHKFGLWSNELKDFVDYYRLKRCN
jgi:hypothetical protein